MPLTVADVHTAPQAPDPTYVGVSNWLWVPPAQWKTLSKTVTAGATSVTVTARPTQVAWTVGEERRTCAGPGKAWRIGMSDAARTACSFTFSSTSDNEPGGVFGVTATIRYAVSWRCRGVCSAHAGALGVVDARSGAGAFRVLQRQTVVVS